MRSGWTRGAVASIGVVVTLVLGACSSAPAVQPEREQPIVPPRGLQPPRTKLADGLVVPEGAKLAGSVFPTPGDDTEHDDWTAYLTVDGDPFAVWDDLAEQARASDGRPMIAGSADACTWTLPDDAGEPGGGEPAGTAPKSTAEATGAAAATTTTAAAEDPYLAAVTITGSAPTAEVDGVQCSASAPALANGHARQVTMQLRSGTQFPATITLQTVWGTEGLTGAPTALRTTLEQQARPGGGPAIEPGIDHVPDGAAEHVPDPRSQPKAKELGPFGPEVNCFAEGGYQKLKLPHGADFVAGGFADGTASVLRVVSVEAALAELRAQVAGDGTSDADDGDVVDLAVHEGQSILEFSVNVSGGGGGCSALSSPNGDFLVVTAHGD